MNAITMTLIFCLFLVFFVFLIMKKFLLNNLVTAINKKDYELVVTAANTPLSRQVLGDYICDLYKIKAYYYSKDVEQFDKMLEHMINFEYKDPENHRNFIELYYHMFILKKNRKYADILLKEIYATNDENFIKYNQQAYEVMINGRNDLIAEMDEEINSKKFYGFSLGVILYMIAIQYLNLGDNKNALTYFETSIVCFSPNEKYVELAKQYINQLA